MEFEYPAICEKSVFHENKLYFVESYNPWIIEMDIPTYEMRILAVIPLELGGVGGKFYMGAYFDGKLILYPRGESKILEYNIQKNSFFCIELLDFGLNYKPHAFARKSIQNENILWILPQSCGHILKYDISKREIICYAKWFECVKKYDWTDLSWFGDGTIIDEKIYLPCTKINAVIGIDVNTGTSVKYYIGNKNNRFVSMEYWNKKICILDSCNMEFFVWNHKKNVIDIQSSLPKEVATDAELSYFSSKSEFILRKIIVNKDRVILAPYIGNSFLEINHDGNVKIIAKKEPEALYSDYLTLKDGSIICTDGLSNKNVKIYNSNFEIINFMLKIESSQIKGHLFTEHRSYNLCNFIDMLNG